MSLTVNNISPQQVTFRGAKPNPRACTEGVKHLQESTKPVNCNYIAGLIGWAALLIGLIGGITYGIKELIKDKHHSEINSMPVNNTENITRTIEYKND